MLQLKDLLQDMGREENVGEKVRQQIGEPSPRSSSSGIVDWRHPLVRQLCDDLGLRNVRTLEMSFTVGGIALVKVELYLEENNARNFAAMMEEFMLVPRS